jgi:aryl-alcohol dehydrogenase-like predicted oxidoreductase
VVLQVAAGRFCGEIGAAVAPQINSLRDQLQWGKQVQINLLHRKVKTNGVLETAHQLGVTLIAFRPLRSGLLTGKLHADRDLAARLPPPPSKD